MAVELIINSLRALFHGIARTRYYTWIADPIRFDSDLEFVPLLWGDADSIKNFDKSVAKVLKDRPETTAVMGMNECVFSFPDGECYPNVKR